MNAIAHREQTALAAPGQGRMTVAEVIGHVTAVQEVMRAVMKEGTHYGKIPGTDKPTLLKPGAEALCLAFHIAPSYRVEDLSTADRVRYRIVCIGTHQLSQVVLGEGLGEASSDEDKYRWRKAVCKEEFDETPQQMRRKKYGKKNAPPGYYVVEQVRTEPADLANTVLKMAVKRAQMAMVLNTTAASDIFSQDLEDMDEALRDHLARRPEEAGGGETGGQQPQAQAQGGQQQAKEAEKPVWPDEKFDKQFDKFRSVLAKGRALDDVIIWAESIGRLTDAQRKRIQDAAAEIKGGAATDVEHRDLPAAETPAQQQPQAAAQPAAADGADPLTAPTYPEIAGKLARAQTVDEVDAAESLIAHAAVIPSLKKELEDKAAERRAALMNARDAQ